MVNEQKNLIKLLSEAIEAGKPAAFVTVISVDGSTPREAGAKMLVYADGGIDGTVGGGTVEALVIKQAVECINERKSGKYSFNLSPQGNTAMMCMGNMDVYIDVYKTPFKVLILGAGHVGLKIAEACHLAGYSYIVADERKEFADKSRFPNARMIINEYPDKAIEHAEVDKNTYIVIVTRGHVLDNQCLVEAMKTKAAYIGMIGSRSKVKAIFQKMAEAKDGPNPLADKRVYSPIGLNLGGKTPGEIAISVVAQITSLYYGRDAKHLRIEE